jgi:CBS domain-containing protein
MTAATLRPAPVGFETARVSDVMTVGVVSCAAGTPLPVVARMMSQHRVHAIVVLGAQADGVREPWGVVSDLDLVESASRGRLDDPASVAAQTPVVPVAPESSLARAVELMAENRTSHLLVADPELGHPLGVISALDVAGVLAARQSWDETD